MTAERMTPQKAIRLYCLECGGGQYAEVRFCTLTNCPLYPWRMGRKKTAKTEGERIEVRELSTEPSKIGYKAKQGHCSPIAETEDATT